ncbi:hypothetical protein BDV10DRAFT_39351 [Aspergillus recurvatus]
MRVEWTEDRRRALLWAVIDPFVPFRLAVNRRGPGLLDRCTSAHISVLTSARPRSHGTMDIASPHLFSVFTLLWLASYRSAHKWWLTLRPSDSVRSSIIMPVDGGGQYSPALPATGRILHGRQTRFNSNTVLDWTSMEGSYDRHRGQSPPNTEGQYPWPGPGRRRNDDPPCHCLYRILQSGPLGIAALSSGRLVILQASIAARALLQSIRWNASLPKAIHIAPASRADACLSPTIRVGIDHRGSAFQVCSKVSAIALRRGLVHIRTESQYAPTQTIYTNQGNACLGGSNILLVPFRFSKDKAHSRSYFLSNPLSISQYRSLTRHRHGQQPSCLLALALATSNPAGSFPQTTSSRRRSSPVWAGSAALL